MHMTQSKIVMTKLVYNNHHYCQSDMYDVSKKFILCFFMEKIVRMINDLKTQLNGKMNRNYLQKIELNQGTKNENEELQRIEKGHKPNNKCQGAQIHKKKNGKRGKKWNEKKIDNRKELVTIVAS